MITKKKNEIGPGFIDNSDNFIFISVPVKAVQKPVRTLEPVEDVCVAI